MAMTASIQQYSPLLYVCSAVIILDGDGKRVLGKYYEHEEKLSSSKAAQATFETCLFQRTRKALNGEVTTYDGRIVVYRANLDVIIYVVGIMEQSELVLATILDTYYEALTELIKPQLDRRAILENFATAVLALDETVDRGIVLETDAQQITKKLAKTPASIVDMPLNEQTISSAFSFAKQHIKSLLK